ncbi:DUF6528 family protein [Chitinophaga qingshengii]|uniref:WD40 repeat domain-containing protein n=1 Tax=Chitinophaga qingshengii TaxID=1569794 RepID=A0ABR7TL87_9BACT|nr:DUF6528 family protein [Chitinophaga qingshengii]MBC9930179.1 hypothetical protein [Chitinophaga qingshengii]
MKKLIISGAVLCATIAACSKNNGNDTTAPPKPSIVNTPEPYPGFPLALTNGATKQIEIYDPMVTDWNAANAKTGRWSPTTTLGFSTDEINRFGGGTDFKVRTINSITYAALADNSMAAIIAYPSGQRVWSKVISGNLHSAELLPNGNIALAASDGNWIRVYTASQGANSSTYTEFPLAAAHAVLWDPQLRCLWVTGRDVATKAHILTALAIGGTDAAPELTELTQYRATLPTAWGHEVSAYQGNKNLLWVTTNGGEYVYNKTTKTLSMAPTNNLTFVKGMGNQPSGQLVLVRPDANKNPRPQISCSANDWSTSTIDFYTAGGQWQGSRVVNGACFYKVKILDANYQ